MSDAVHAPFADSHVHLADAQFTSDVHDVVARAREAGARAIVCIGESPATALRAADLAAQYPDLIAFTCGLHPHEAKAWDASHPDAIRRAVELGAVAIGECGLDFHYDFSPREQQRGVFGAQLALARELNKPVVVHTRTAEDDTRDMLTDAARDGVRGVLHCFTGSPALAEVAIENDWCLSFSGVVTFKRYADDAVLRMVPDHLLLVESDAPYLAPVPHRGHRNEPAWVQHTVARVAAARGVTPAALSELTLTNTRRFFGLDAHMANHVHTST